MKLTEMIYDNFLRIVIAIIVIWTFFTFGPVHAFVAALIPTGPHIRAKLDEIMAKRNKLLHKVDESGEYKSGEYKKQQREFKEKWRLR